MSGGRRQRKGSRDCPNSSSKGKFKGCIGTCVFRIDTQKKKGGIKNELLEFRIKVGLAHLPPSVSLMLTCTVAVFPMLLKICSRYRGPDP